MTLTAADFGMDPPHFASEEEAAEYAAWVISFQNRPLDFVLTFWPWGIPGTRLENRRLEDWQFRMFERLQEKLLAAESEEQRAHELGEVYNAVYRIARPAGHGVGKTAAVAMVIHWFASTHPNPQAIVTASTEGQLSTKTWRELRRWQEMALNGWMFEWSATRYRHRGKPDTWYVSAIPWSESNPSAFAGAHEQYVLVLFDEASGIHPVIWETIQGALTTGKCFFFAFGNPVEPEGGFYEACTIFRHRWDVETLDARSVSFANMAEINEWLEDHGEDSDFFRVRVRGEFPKSSSNQFIDHDRVARARKRNIEWRDIPRTTPKLMGVDVSRQGGDRNVIVMRQGRKMARKIIRFQSRDLMQIAQTVARAIREMQPDVVYVDEVGLGAGVVDRLHQLGYDMVVGVQSGSTSQLDERSKKIYANNRMLMWTRMREWLDIADLADDPELERDLTGPTYGYQKKTQLELLESKDDMRARGLPSPDTADALSFTFYEITPTRRQGSMSAEPEAV